MCASASCCLRSRQRPAGCHRQVDELMLSAVTGITAHAEVNAHGQWRHQTRTSESGSNMDMPVCASLGMRRACFVRCAIALCRLGSLPHRASTLVGHLRMLRQFHTAHPLQFERNTTRPETEISNTSSAELDQYLQRVVHNCLVRLPQGMPTVALRT